MKRPLRPGLELEYLPLKIVVALLPVSLLRLYLPGHESAELALGLSLGIVLSQLVPPRQSMRRILFWIAIFALVGLATAAFPQWNW
jgi:hypothetical protein